MLNQLLLVSCICIVAALALYFFYWNRFIAFVFGLILRLLWWNQEASSIWIEIGAIHFSLISGRILLKDVIYHSSNQTIKILKGQIQWRYWIRRPSSEEDVFSTRGEDESPPCRVQLSFQGVEWFLYNRTASYDSIVSQMERSNPTSFPNSAKNLFSRGTRESNPPAYPPSATPKKSAVRLPTFIRNALDWVRRQLPNLDPKDLLPLGIDVETGVFVLGNPSTPSLLVAEFQRTFGTYGMTPARSSHDLYKQVLNLKFRNVLLELLANPDYVDPMTTIGGLVHSRIKQQTNTNKPSNYQSYRSFLRLWRQNKLFGLLMDYFSDRRSQRLAQQTFKFTTFGLRKHNKVLDEETPVGIDFATYDYAIKRKVLEAPSLDLIYKVDEVGEVPERTVHSRFKGNNVDDIGNRDVPPEWSFHLVIKSGVINYGPWTDRQRTELQKFFFPSTYQDVEVHPQLHPGDKRVWDSLQVFIELRDQTALNIPFREASRDWQWDGHVNMQSRPKKREPAFLNMLVGDRSSISYVMPMIAGPTGYESTLEVHLDSVVIASSLNDIRLISLESARVRCELPTPLRWNEERTWSFSISLRQPLFYLLRDHVNMFTDLGKDWVSGPPTDYQKFIPMIYRLTVEMHHFEVNLYLNDQNVIDKPLIKDENSFLVLRGPRLINSVTVPSNVFRPEVTLIAFTVLAPDVIADFLLPRWNTHAAHAPKDGLTFFKTDELCIDASYRYFAEVREGNADKLGLHFRLRNPVFKAFGWSIRQFIALKDNYFGSFTLYQTLYEYLDKRRRNLPVGDPILLKYRPGKANMMQVEVNLQVPNVTLLAPSALVGSGRSGTLMPSSQRLNAHNVQDCLVLTIPEVQFHLRMHEHFLEMSLNTDIIKGRFIPDPSLLSDTSSNPILSIDRLDIVANRLFGPQPRTSTYVCIWEIVTGHIAVSASPAELGQLAAVGNAFRLNFVDLANAPAAEFLTEIDPDVTFYKVAVKSVDLISKVGSAAFSVHLDQGLKVDTNDLGTDRYKKITSVRVPHVSVQALVTASTHRNSWLEAAEIIWDTSLDIYSAPNGFVEMNKAQTWFIEEQDRLTGRTRAMFDRIRRRDSSSDTRERTTHQTAFYLPHLSLPSPQTRSRGDQYVPTMSSLHSRPPSWRHPKRGNVSESEDDGVSEVDRNAWLAQTRTSTPVARVFHHEDNAIMSSGDESDDTDLTDGDSTGDEWSNMEDSEEQTSSALLSFYSPLTRHYSLVSSHEGGFDRDVFAIAKEGTLFRTPSSSSLFSMDEVPFSPPILDDLPSKKGLDTTTFRIRSTNGVQIVVTPLALLCISAVEEHLSKLPHQPLLTIDTLMVDSIPDATVDRSSNCAVFDVFVPEVSMRLLQHVSLAAKHTNTSMTPSASFLSSPSNLDVTAFVDVSVGRLSATGYVAEGQTSLNSSVARMELNLDMSTDKKTLHADLPNATILKLSFSESALRVTQRTLSPILGDILIEIGHHGPELVLAMTNSLLASTAQFSDSLKAMSDHHRSALQSFLTHILNESKESAIIDPLSTIQPSYFVQTGLPLRLRTDVSFRLLYHLRTYAWNNIHSAQLLAPDVVTSDSLLSLIESRLEALDQDASHASEIGFLRGVTTGDNVVGNKPKPKRSWSSVSISVSSTTVRILAPAGGASSHLQIKDINVGFHTKKSQLIQFNLNVPSSTSQSSMRGKIPRPLHKSILFVSTSDISLVILPHLMDFAQHVLRVHRYFEKAKDARSPIQEVIEKTSPFGLKLSHVDVLASFHRINLQAAAENLVVVLGIHALQLSSSLLLSSNKTQRSMNFSVLFNEAYVQARSPSNPSKETEQDILAALTFLTGRFNGIARPGSGTIATTIKGVSMLTGLRLHVPRSALRLYRFVQEWRADYLPGMEAAVKTLLTEYRARPVTLSKEENPPLDVQIHGQINHFEISLQVMHGTWLSLEINKTVAYYQAPQTSTSSSIHDFGLQLAAIILSISSNPIARDVAPNSRVKLVLPPLSLSGNSDGHRVVVALLFEFIELKVKPSHWDTLLAVQQKFGQDFNDIVGLMQRTREKPNKTGRASRPVEPNTMEYRGNIKMKGFRIGLEGIASTVLLECQDINGGFRNTEGWAGELGLLDLALSLAPRFYGRQSHGFNRNHRSAFVTIDFHVSARQNNFSQDKHLQFTVSKIHAVMQPSSIGEFGDFIDNMQAEMLERQEQRALELAAFKEKTRKILETFDVNVGELPEETPSWIHDFILNVAVKNIGVAFPLIHDEELELPRPQKKNATAVRAFLFAIHSIEFGSHRGETGQAVMKHLTFQFIPSFRQNLPAHFTADNHQSRNRLIYPEMKAQLRSSTTGNARKIWISAQVDGFCLDLDSSIPTYIFSLIDVYRQGKDRVERLSTIVPHTPLTPSSSFERNRPALEKHYPSIPTSNIFGDLTFMSGKVRLFSEVAGSSLQRDRLSLQKSLDLPDEQVLAYGAEVFRLPIVSLWAEYRATSALQKLRKGLEHEPSILMFKSTVHSSQNILRPTLLPFITEFVGYVESRMRKISTRPAAPPLLPLPSPSFSSVPKEAATNSVATMQICFNLRIDQSKLELTCLPDVNVVAGLHWESGGFVVNVSPGAKKVGFSGTVSGLTIGLKHGFLSEDCVRLDARNLITSVSFSKADGGPRGSLSSISVVVDTEFLGGVRFSRLQDILCFKAVWLDRIPIFNPSPSTTDTKALLQIPVEPQVPEPEKQTLVTTVLVRVRQIHLDIDLGQSIASVNLKLQQTIFRTKITEELNEAFLFVEDVIIDSKGNITGHAHVPSCIFQTIRRSEEAIRGDVGTRRMLELKLTSGPLIVVLESDHQRLLHYRADPIEVEIFDDWSKTNLQTISENHPLQLSFTVTSPEVVAVATVGTIPKLVAYVNKFKANLEAQRLGAFRESQTFRVTRTPKPDNPLSAVAQAMLQSARSRFKEAEMELSYAIRQRMSLRLKLLRLVVFPRTMNDTEIAQFTAHNVEANLNRLVGSDLSPAQRDLELAFSSMIISKYTQIHQPTPQLGSSSALDDGREWLSLLFRDAVEATIVGLPSMKMHMVSEEQAAEASTSLIYDFFSEFVRREGMKAFEDIYITLNMSLYSWLTVLRKNLTREMDQVRGSEDWRTTIPSVPVASGSTQRKRVPDPLPLGDSPRSATLPSASYAALSPYSPYSARYAGRTPMSAREHLLSPLSAQPSPVPFPTSAKSATDDIPISQPPPPRKQGVDYKPRNRHIERLTMRQLGEATPDVMHPFFMKKAGFNLEDSLPQYVNEYATVPLEEIMAVLLKLYSRQLLSKNSRSDTA